ncbi:hypothetical protein HY992_00055 [Candidatus Micrarchaeota archaeon]|nr:hypothetical protein [Candidatus Micrarchaeota archaeon]
MARKQQFSLKKYLFESRRQFAHMAFGLAVIAMLKAFEALYFENARFYATYVLTVAFMAGLIVLDLKIKNRKIPILDELLKLLERPRAMPGHGAFWFGVGILALFAFLKSTNEISAGILVLAIGDGFSTLAGTLGSNKLFYNEKKTLEGTLAFFFSACTAIFFMGWLAIPLAALCALVESFNLHLDDNALIPITCIVFFNVF